MAGESYGILLNSYFDGATGMRLQARGNKDALIVGAFLMANEFANMIGLYELSLPKLERKLPIVKTRAAFKRALDALSEEHYAFYDMRTEFVWVREMARVRLQLKGIPLAPNDNRLLGANKLYARLPLNPFLGPFYDRYVTELRIPTRRGGGPLQLEGASQGASQGARRTPSTTSVDQGSGIRDQVLGNRDQVTEKAAAAPRVVRYDAADPTQRQATVETLTALLRKEIIPLLGRQASVAELKDAAAWACGRMTPPMEWHPDDMRKAIDSALAREGLTH